MKKQLLTLLTIILTINGYSQIIFEKGYYINNSDQKTECLIKNIDWKNNPTQFEYKLTENSSTEKANIATIKEFGIYNVSKYIRSNVKIDRSEENINDLSYDKNPIFKEEQLFLKVLIEGKANLYFYEDGNLVRFFYNVSNAPIKQLIYKSYHASNFKIGKNNRFRQQLWIDLKCPHFTMNKFENIDYRKKDLTSFFIKYNECNNHEFVNFAQKQQKEKKDVFNLSIRAGLNHSSLSIQNTISNSQNVDFDHEFEFRFGIEAELILPFNKNKWALLIEPTYQYYKSEDYIQINSFNWGKLTASANYQSIEIPIGIRHYFHLNDNSKIFANISYTPGITINSSIDFSRPNSSKPQNTLEIKTGPNIDLGAGYKFKNKYSLELRYHTDRDILNDYSLWQSDYKTVSVIFGYTLF